MDKVITRSEAKSAGLKRYFTGSPCKNGHVSERRVDNKTCFDCQRASVEIWQKANPERKLEIMAKWRSTNPERKRSADAAWYSSNADYRRGVSSAWRTANPEKVSTHRATRRARKLAAIPAEWSEFDAFVIEEAAAACKRRAAMTGYAWHVDHMIPLAKGGLHAWNNIQVIPAKINLAKGDKLTLTARMEWVGGLPGAS